MRDYSLNDIGFNPEPVKLLRAGEGLDEEFDMDAIREESRINREKNEQLLHEFEERTKDLVVS